MGPSTYYPEIPGPLEGNKKVFHLKEEARETGMKNAFEKNQKKKRKRNENPRTVQSQLGYESEPRETRQTRKKETRKNRLSMRKTFGKIR